MTSTERLHKRPTTTTTSSSAMLTRKSVEREKSLSLDDVFAKSFLKDAYGAAASQRHRTPKEARSLCGDKSTKKAPSRSSIKPRKSSDYDDDAAEESGNETDTGHSVATTGHRSQRRVSKMHKSMVSLSSTSASPAVKKRSQATAGAATADQGLAGLYSARNRNDDTESEESSKVSGDQSPVKRSQPSSSAKRSTSSRPELSKERSCRRTASSDTATSGAETPASRDASRPKPGTSVRSGRDRPESSRAKSSIDLAKGRSDRSHNNAERKVQIHPDDSGEPSHRVPRSPSKVRRDKERLSERHLGDRPKQPKSERHLKERGKSERHMKDREPSERKLRERSKSRTRVPSTPKQGESSTPRVSRGTSSRDGTPRQSSSADQRSRSSRRRAGSEDIAGAASSPEDKVPAKSRNGPRSQSPRPMRSASSSRSKPLVEKTTPSRRNDNPSKPKSTKDVGSPPAGKDANVSKGSPATKDRRKTESTEGTATATEDPLSSDESSNDDDGHCSSTVLQFDPSQQGDNGVYRVQQVASTNSRSMSGDGGRIAAVVDPLGAARQLNQPNRPVKDAPIFQFLESTDFDYFPPASALSPLDRPSGDEASEDDDLVDSPGYNDSRQSLGADVVPPEPPRDAFFTGLTDDLVRDETQFGYSGDGTFVDDNNPYGYNVEETYENHGGASSRAPVAGNDSYDDDVYLYDDDDIGTGSFSNPYGFGMADPTIPARDSLDDDGSQLYETDSTSHYDQQSTLHDSFMPQSGAPQFNPSTFGGTEPFFISNDDGDDASFEGAWEAAKADPKASAAEFDQSFDQSFNFEELKRTASTDGSQSNMHQSHESNDVGGRRPPGDGPKKKRIVKVKVIKKSSDEQGGQDQGGKPVKRKVVRKKVKAPAAPNESPTDAESDSTKTKEQSPTASEPINERKKALHQMKAPRTPQTPSKVFVSKLYGSLSRFNNSGNLNSDDGSLTEEGLMGAASKQATRSPAANLQPGMSPGASASGKRAFATSIGRYFSRNVRNPPIAGSVGNGADEGSISTNNSRGSRGSLGLFVGKKSNRAKHQLLGDDSSYDSGHLVKR